MGSLAFSLRGSAAGFGIPVLLGRGSAYDGVMKTLGIVVGIVLALGIAGHVSGNQPDRDAVAAASEELGIAFGRQRIDVGEVTLNVVFAGPADGAPVVLLHGFPEFWYAWRGPAAVLARAGFRVIVPDQRGYNRSDKPAGTENYHLRHLVRDIEGLADALGYERISIGCQDMGSGVGWRFLMEHPDRVDRFAVVNAGHPVAWRTLGDGVESDISWYRTFIQLPWIPGFAARVNNWALLANSLRDTSAPGAFGEEEMDQLRSAWDRDGAIHTMGDWYRADFWDWERSDEEARIDRPVLILLSEYDAFIPPDAAHATRDWADEFTLIELGSGSHWVTAEEPERIGDLLTAFFGSVNGDHLQNDEKPTQISVSEE